MGVGIVYPPQIKKLKIREDTFYLKNEDAVGGRLGDWMLGRKPQMPPTSLCFVTAAVLVTEDGKWNETEAQSQDATSLVESLVISVGSSLGWHSGIERIPLGGSFQASEDTLPISARTFTSDPSLMGLVVSPLT